MLVILKEKTINFTLDLTMFSFDLMLLSFGPVVVAKTEVGGLFSMSDILTDKIFFLKLCCNSS